MHTSPRCDTSASLPSSGWVEDLSLFRSTSSNIPSLFTNSCQPLTLKTINSFSKYNKYYDSGSSVKKIKTNTNEVLHKNQTTSELISKPKKKFWPSKDSIIEKQVIQIYDSDDETNGCNMSNGNDTDSLVMKDPAVSHLDLGVIPEKEMSREHRILELRQIEQLLEMQRLSVLSTIMSQKKLKEENVQSYQLDFNENFGGSEQSNQTNNSTASNDSNRTKSQDSTVKKRSKSRTLQKNSEASLIILDSDDEDTKGNSAEISVEINKPEIKSGLLSSKSLNDALRNLRTETEVGTEFQVCVPDFTLNKKRSIKLKREPKLIWTPDLIERDNLERIMQDLSKIIRMNVTNQESVTKILKSFQMDDQQMLSTIRRNKGSYRNHFHFPSLIPK